jgi:hypothetical protein
LAARAGRTNLRGDAALLSQRSHTRRIVETTGRTANQVRLHFIQLVTRLRRFDHRLDHQRAHIGGKYALWRTGYCTELLIADARGRNSTELEIR